MPGPQTPLSLSLCPVPSPPPDHYYGCVVRKKVMYLEELKTGTQDFGGWLWGAGVSPRVSPACALLPWAVPCPGAKSPFSWLIGARLGTNPFYGPIPAPAGVCVPSPAPFPSIATKP